MHGKNGFAALLVIFLAVQTVSALPAPKVVCFDLAPFIISDNGNLTGPGIEYTQQLLDKAGISSKVELMPLPRGIAELDNGNTIFLILTRTPAREPKYTWITEIYMDSISFATLPSATPINSYSEATAAAGNILVARAGAPATMLAANKVTNIDDGVSLETQNLAKLQGNRGVAWFSSTSQFLSLNAKAGKQVVKIGKSISPAPMWMLASKDIDPVLVKKLQDADAALRAQGVYDKIFAELKQ